MELAGSGACQAGRLSTRAWKIAISALALFGLWMLVTPSAAWAGGTWTSVQCYSDTRQGAPDAQLESNGGQHFTNFQWCGTSNDPPAMILALASNPSWGDYAQFHFVAPNGSVISRVQQWAWMNSGSSGTIRPDLFYTAAGGGDVAYASGNAPFWAFYDSGDIFASRVGGALSCVVPRCSGDWTTAIDQSDVFVTLTDTAAPSTPTVSGSLIDSGWIRGSRSVTMNASDEGGGVALLGISVNGQVVAGHDPCEEEYVPGLAMTLRLKPCASTAAHNFGALNTAQPPFHDGANTIAACAAEFGSNPAVTCDNRTVNVDNLAPDRPQDLTLDGGDGWRADNDFDVSWTNPPHDGYAPYDGAVYELVNSQGQAVEGPTVVGDDAVDHLDDVEVPSAGAYTLRVRLRDAAGNESAVATTTLRFDPTAPGNANAETANGWIGRGELPYVQGWKRPIEVPASGLAGFATGVDRNSTTDPCAADGDLSSCSSAEISHGQFETSQVISDLPEGTDNWFHTASVSGAGRRSAVDHVQLKVDKTDPTVELGGVPTGYANQPVTLQAAATDALSGMQPVADDDGQPRTCIAIDGAPATCAGGSHVTVEIASSGVHSVRYWARDLAGNQPSPDQAQTATVKVDLALGSLDVWLKAKRKVRAGRKVTFTGAARAPQADMSAGKLVEIQAKVGKRWKTVGEAFRTAADGTFTFQYRFRRFYTQPTRYKFRLKVTPEAGWPYAEPLYSAKRKIKVVPRKGKREK